MVENSNAEVGAVAPEPVADLRGQSPSEIASALRECHFSWPTEAVALLFETAPPMPDIDHIGLKGCKTKRERFEFLIEYARPCVEMLRRLVPEVAPADVLAIVGIELAERVLIPGLLSKDDVVEVSTQTIDGVAVACAASPSLAADSGFFSGPDERMLFSIEAFDAWYSGYRYAWRHSGGSSRSWWLALFSELILVASHPLDVRSTLKAALSGYAYSFGGPKDGRSAPALGLGGMPFTSGLQLARGVLQFAGVEAFHVDTKARRLAVSEAAVRDSIHKSVPRDKKCSEWLKPIGAVQADDAHVPTSIEDLAAVRELRDLTRDCGDEFPLLFDGIDGSTAKPSVASLVDGLRLIVRLLRGSRDAALCAAVVRELRGASYEEVARCYRTTPKRVRTRGAHAQELLEGVRRELS